MQRSTLCSPSVCSIFDPTLSLVWPWLVMMSMLRSAWWGRCSRSWCRDGWHASHVYASMPDIFVRTNPIFAPPRMVGHFVPWCARRDHRRQQSPWWCINSFDPTGRKGKQTKRWRTQREVMRRQAYNGECGELAITPHWFDCSINVLLMFLTPLGSCSKNSRYPTMNGWCMAFKNPTSFNASFRPFGPNCWMSISFMTYWVWLRLSRTR